MHFEYRIYTSSIYTYIIIYSYPIHTYICTHYTHILYIYTQSSTPVFILQIFPKFCNTYFLFHIKFKMNLYLITSLFVLADTLSSLHVLNLKFFCSRGGTQVCRVTFMANNKCYRYSMPQKSTCLHTFTYYMYNKQQWQKVLQ